MLAGENSRRQRRPRRDRQPQRPRHGHQFALDRSLDEIPLDLQRDGWRPTAQLGDRVGPRHPPRRRVRHAAVQNFSLPHQIIEAAHDFLGRRHLIPDVQPVKIDVIGFQSLERCLDRDEHRLALIPAGVRIGAGRGVGVFGRQHHAIPPPLHELAAKGFAGALCVEVGSIEEIAAGVEERVEHLPRLVFARAPAPVFAEGHGAEADFRNAKSGFAEKFVAHESPSCAWCDRKQTVGAGRPAGQVKCERTSGHSFGTLAFHSRS